MIPSPHVDGMAAFLMPHQLTHLAPVDILILVLYFVVVIFIGFFVGGLTLLYGVVLLPYGAWAWFGQHEAQTVLHHLHPTFWWGLLLTVFGGFYTVRFRPRSGKIS
ncbi:hypothetical protein [Granulicella mallensis]|uniref:Uncharacterized protein n=1 Tax=Granulicella mallensis (strain ATCC BAA-1857 / DSM 23137 / MP5ACTX8) TaxID=682795 RepID=G8NQI6_GRAMM|nr:hypothetical protein [Granulicella mallensis]AEU37212.1 hypothetical protein AciX8_2909 [Granulicella mallensis MP5ACTX8]